MVTVKFPDLLDGYEFANFGNSFESVAYINLDSGTILFKSDEMELEEELPEDIDFSDRYIAVPRKKELGLGRDLALSFVEEELPGDFETIACYFQKQGAYSRFKGLLEDRGIIDKWFEFERIATEIALRHWCKKNDITLID